MIRFKKSAPLFVAATLLLGLASCGGNGRKPAYPVHGTVLYKGKPAEGAQVVFVPVEEDADTPRPGAQVKRDGSFRLSTYRSYDGAPGGRYAVTIIYRSPEKKVNDENLGPDLLNGKYGNPKTTPLHVEVREGANSLEPFDLK